MARNCHALLIVLALVLVSCRSPSSPTPPSGPFTVHGTLTDFATGTPLSGGRVGLAGDDPSAAREAVSDVAGRYALDLNGTGSPLTLSVWLDETRVGDVVVGSEAWRGDLLAGGTGCVSSYGVVVDADSGRAVAGAAVTVGGTSTTSAADGWYRIDLGCPPGGVIGFNTSFAEVTHPQYATLMRVVGRGIARVERLDLALGRRSSAGSDVTSHLVDQVGVPSAKNSCGAGRDALKMARSIARRNWRGTVWSRCDSERPRSAPQ